VPVAQRRAVRLGSSPEESSVKPRRPHLALPPAGYLSGVGPAVRSPVGEAPYQRGNPCCCWHPRVAGASSETMRR